MESSQGRTRWGAGLAGHAAWLFSDRTAWLLLAALSCSIFAGLATAGRIPAVDLPQHALILRRMLEEDQGAYAVNWSTPYLLFFVIARVFAWFTDPATAVWRTFALALALLPLASGVLAASLKRSPAMGCFSMLAVFSEVAAWGFGAFILGCSVAVFSLAVAITYARRPSRRSGALLAGLLALCYWTHPLCWAIALAATWSVVSLRLEPWSWRRLWPLVGSTALTITLFLYWLKTLVIPERMAANIAGEGNMKVVAPDRLARIWQRLADLGQQSSAFGRDGELLPAWSVVAALLFVAVGTTVTVRLRALRRDTRQSLSETVHWRTFYGRIILPCILFTSIVCYLAGPFVLLGVLGVHIRFLLFTALLVPIALGGVDSRLVRASALAAGFAGLWLVILARNEVNEFDQRTECYDQVIAQARDGESLLALRDIASFADHPMPVSWHLAAELVARKGGLVAFDFADLGMSPVRLRPGWRREVVPAAEDAALYDRTGDREFTAWLYYGARATPPQPPPGFRIARCGQFALLVDETVAAGSRPAVRYLPHRVR